MLPFPGAGVGPYRLAEWVESGLLLGGLDGPLSRATLRDHLHESLDDADLRRFDAEGLSGIEADPEAAAFDDLRNEEAEGVAPADVLADDTFEVLVGFATAAGDGYPFAVSDRLVAVRGTPEDWPVYRFLLALSQRFLHGLEVPAQRPARVFERLSACAWGAYLPGRAEHFGWPRSGPVGTRSFRQAAPTVVKLSGERLTTSASSLPKRLKDMECDVFAWRPFEGDSRRGQDVLLAQCAIGDGWDTKHVNLDRWRAHVTFAVVPRKGASFPFVPRVMRPANLTWEEVVAEEEDLGASVGLWLDRLRLAQLVGRDGAEAALEGHLLDSMREWTDVVVKAAGGTLVSGDDGEPDAAFCDLDEDDWEAPVAETVEDGLPALPVDRS